MESERNRRSELYSNNGYLVSHKQTSIGVSKREEKTLPIYLAILYIL